MKILYATLWCSLMMTQVNAAMKDEIHIQIDGIEPERGGNIIVMIFGAEGFPLKHDKALLIQSKSASQNTITFKFEIAIEKMAVKVLHDENEDRKVTKNWTGIYPKEGLGFSNNQYISLTGPPEYKDSVLSRRQFKQGLSISLKYP